jgi:signal peptidase II
MPMARSFSRRFALWMCLALGVALADQLTKYAITQFLRPGERWPVTDFFDVVLLYNTGAAFSFLADQGGWQRWFFTVLAFGISTWLAFLIREHQDETLQPLAFALIIGGAIGNAIDRLHQGAVTDFLFFHVGAYGWPAFNLADSAITVGVVLMFIGQWRAPSPPKEP